MIAVLRIGSFKKALSEGRLLRLMHQQYLREVPLTLIYRFEFNGCTFGRHRIVLDHSKAPACSDRGPLAKEFVLESDSPSDKYRLHQDAGNQAVESQVLKDDIPL